MNGADCIWRSTSIQHVQIEPGVNSDPEMIPFGSKSVTRPTLRASFEVKKKKKAGAKPLSLAK